MGLKDTAVEPDRGGDGAGAGEREEGLDLFSRRRRAAMTGSLEENGRHNGSFKNISVASAIAGRNRTDDFLDVEMGKHDYDWLLTPPTTPIFPSSDANENQQTSTAAKNRFTVKSSSSAGASRLSSSQPENVNSTRPMRSSSANRPSVSATHSNSLFTAKTSSLNTSTASVTSRPSTPARPSTPGSRSSSSSRASAGSRSLQARSTNPAKTRPNLTSSAGDKPRPPQSSRPSTPTGRPQLPNSPVVRSTSRPSTPTRRPNTPGLSSSPTTTAGRSPSAGRLPASRNSGSRSRPSSPGSLRPRTLISSIDLTLFSSDAPPNLRTKLPVKPASAGRTRPGMALTVRASSNIEVPASAGSGRKNSLPFAVQSKVPDSSAKIQSSKSDHDPVLLEIQKLLAPEPGVRRASKSGLTEASGFGRTMSKMSLDLALKHMDIRQSMGGIRANMIFPHSIRPGIASKSNSAHHQEPIVPITNNDKLLSEAGRLNITISNNEHVAAKPMNKDGLIAKGSETDLYGSSRYDTMIQKEDLKNTNWLHSFEDKSDQSPVFDHRFEPPPEPFSPL